jgi:NADPH:quinone reductase-like Zn-dependent oxidoreductase
VLVYGASGSMGTAGVQLAVALGAHVTAVTSTRHLELVKSLGAEEAIDYTQDDFTKSGLTYDVIFDAVGKTSFRRCWRSLKRGGTFLETDIGFGGHVPLLIVLTRWFGSKRVKVGVPGYTKANLLFIRDLIKAGKYRAVVDRRYPLQEAVEAARYVETGRKTGNVVLLVAAGKEAPIPTNIASRGARPMPQP